MPPPGDGSLQAPVLYYDARCSVCKRFVAFALARDTRGLLRLATLQGARGDALRQAYPAFAGRESAVWVAPGARPVGYSDAILATLDYLGGAWRGLARAGRLVPRPLRDRLYRSFADHRSYFGRIGIDRLDANANSRHIDQELMSPDSPRTVEPDALVSYLNDHLAGSVAAVRLIERIAEAHDEAPLGRTMHEFRQVICDEQKLLRSLVETAGGTESSLSQAMGWIGEKFSRLKIGPGTRDPSGLELFEALEAISLGFWGRRALWRSLAQLQQRTPLRVEADFDALALRAEQQLDALERYRLEAALIALAPAPGSARA
jgi:predicted DCC family thiol-disulfide oxidoreductase YuxK